MMAGTGTQFSSTLRKILVAISVFLISACPGFVLAQSGAAQGSPSGDLQGRDSNQQLTPYEKEFAKLRSEFQQASAARQASLLARAYRLREFLNEASSVCTWMVSVAGDGRLHPLVRDEATQYLAAIDAHTANLPAAEAKLASLGLVRQWSLRPGAAGVGKETWTTMGAIGPQLWIDVSGAAPSGGTVYAASAVYSDAERNVALRFSAKAAMSVSLNGSELYSDNGAATGAAFDQHAVGAHLVPGWNSILVRLRSTDPTHLKFELRVSELQGGGVPLKAGARVEHTSPQSPSVMGLPVSDLVEMASAELRGDSQSPDKLETLGMIEAEHGHASALDHLEAAALREPTSGRWLRVAEACLNQPCTFRALTAAHSVDPKNERAMLAMADYYIGRNQVEKARELLQSAIEIEPADFVARYRMVELYAAEGLTDLVLQRTRELQKDFPAPLWMRIKAAERYFEAGLLGEARTLLNSVLHQDFDNVGLRKQLRETLRRMRDTETLNAMAAEDARLNQGENAGSSSAVAKDDYDSDSALSGYLEDVAEVVASARLKPPSDNASAVALSDTRVERVGNTGLSTVRVQQFFYILSDQGARQYTTQNVQYAPSSQRLQVVHARIHKADGKTVEGRDGDDARVADTSVAMYYDVRSHEVQFPGLEKGDVVELDYSITPTTTANPYGDYFGSLLVFRTAVPERLKRYVLIASAARKLNIVEARMAEPAAVSESNGERVYRWQAKDVPPLSNETRGPSVTEMAPYVHVSTFFSWEELGRWYAEMVKPQFATNTELRDTAARLIAGKKSEFEKINAIYQFVLHNTHYVAMEFGVYSYKPYPVTQTYARRFGDCKDKASLMIALLREAGIEADFALLRTRRMGEVDKNATSITLFNHAIVHLPKWDMWLDGTADYFTSGELPVEDQGAMALVVAADGRSSLRTIPITRPQDNYTRRVVRASLGGDGLIHFEGASYTRGEEAPGLRRDFEIPGRQRDSFRSSLAQVFPSVRVDDVRVLDENGEPAVNVEFRGTIDNFAGQRTVSLATSWTQSSYVQKLAPSISRTQDLLLPAPWTREEELRFQIPENAQVIGLPSDTDLRTQFGTARIHYERRGREIVISTSVQMTAIRIAPSEYGAFRAFCQAVEKAFRNEVKVAVRG